MTYAEKILNKFNEVDTKRKEEIDKQKEGFIRMSESIFKFRIEQAAAKGKPFITIEDILDDCKPVKKRIGINLIAKWAKEQGFEVKYDNIWWNPALIEPTLNEPIGKEDE